MNTELVELDKIYLNYNLEDLPNEIWVDVKGYEGWYMVSSLGRVKSMKRNQYSYFVGGVFVSEKIKIMKNGLTNKGYVMTSLSKDGIETKYGVHCLVASHFVDNPNNYDIVDHMSMVKTQNNFQNLRWTTRSQNTVWAQEAGVFGSLYKPKFNKEQVLSIFNDKRSLDELAKEYGVDRSTIHLIRVGKNYSRFTGKKYIKKYVRLKQQSSMAN